MEKQVSEKSIDLVGNNRAVLIEYRERFRRTFGSDMSHFMHPLFGFDVIGFDRWLKTPDGISTSDFIKKEYTDEAEALIREILDKDLTGGK